MSKKPHTLKSCLALLLALCMVFGVLPATAFAAEPTYVAQVGDNKYETVQTAIDAAASGATITLLSDTTCTNTLTFSNGKVYTLDLAGHTLTINVTNVDGIVVTGGATLNLVDTGDNGTYVYNCGSASNDAIFVNNTEANKTTTLNVVGVTLKNEVDLYGVIHAEGGAGSAVVNIGLGTVIKISGKATSQFAAILIGSNATLNMVAGEVTIGVEFEGTYSMNNDAAGVVLLGANAKANLNGGTFSITGKNAFVQGVQIGYGLGNCEFVIDGAVFEVKKDGDSGDCYAFAVYSPADGTVEVKSGVVTGDFTELVTVATGSAEETLEISGGSFPAGVTIPEDYLADNVAVNADGQVVKKLNYVSLGDSMTNGYGLPGYDGCTGCNLGTGTHAGHNGLNEVAKDAYPYLLANHYGWELTQLATSAMRVEDLHFILEYDYDNSQPGEYEGDNWTYSELVNNGDRWDIDNDDDNIPEGVAEKFQNSVRVADVITNAAGNGNFGVFLMGRITDGLMILSNGPTNDELEFYDIAVALNDNNVDASTQEIIMVAYNAVADYIKGLGIPENMANALLGSIGYTLVSYVINYEGAMDAILTLNPDVTLINVGLVNTLSGLSMTIEGQTINFGEIFGYMQEPLNLYVSGITALWEASGKYPDASFLYAAPGEVEIFAKSIKGLDLSDAENSLIRDRVLKSINQTILSLIDTSTNLSDVKTLESAIKSYNSGELNTAVSTIMTAMNSELTVDRIKAAASYLGLEDAVLASVDGNLSLEAFAALTSDLNALFAGVMSAVTENVSATVASKSTEVQSVATTLSSTLGEAANETAKALIAALNTPGILSKTMTDNDILAGMLGIFARLMLGDGLAAHPSTDGHETLFNSIKETIDSGYTTTDHLTDKALELVDLIKEYGPEAAEMAFNYACATFPEFAYVVDRVSGYYDAIEAAEAYEEYLTIAQAIAADVQWVIDEYDLDVMAAEAIDWLVLMAKTYVDPVVSDYVGLLTATLEELVTTYGPDALWEAYLYAYDNIPEFKTLVDTMELAHDTVYGWYQLLAGACGGSQAEEQEQTSPKARTVTAKASADTSANSWGDLLEDAYNTDHPENVAAIHNACLQIAAELAEIIEAHDVAGKVQMLYAGIKAALTFMEPVTTQIAKALEYLVNEYGMLALGVAVNYLDEQGILDLDAIAGLKTTVETKLGEWNALLAAAEGDAQATHAACVQIANELWAIIEEYNIDDAAAQIVAGLKAAVTVLDPYAEELAEVLVELIKIHGPVALDALFSHMDEQGCFDGAKALAAYGKARLEAWHDMIVAAGEDLVALHEVAKTIVGEIVWFIEDNDVVGKVETVLGVIDAVLDVINDYDEVKDLLTDLIAQYGPEVLDLVVSYIETTYAGEIAAVKQVIDDIKSTIENIQNMTEEEWLEVAKQAADALVDHLVEQGVLDLDAIMDCINWVVDQHDSIVDAVEQVKQVLADLIDEYGDNVLDFVVNYVEKNYPEEVATVKAYVEYLKSLEDKTPAELAELLYDHLVAVGVIDQDEVDALISWVEAQVAIMEGYVETAVEAVKAALDHAVEQGLILQAQAEAIYAKLLELKAMAEEAPEQVVACLEQLVADATYYAGHICEPVYAAAAGNNYADVWSMTQGTVLSADVITYQLEAAELLKTVLTGEVNGEAIDWHEYLNDEAYAVAEQLEAKLMAHLADKVDATALELVRGYAKNAAFACVNYVVTAFQDLAALQQVNPDALIVLVGMYNPARGLIVEVGEDTVDLGELFDYVIEATNLYNLGLAIVLDNVVFVDVADAATKGINETIDLDNISIMTITKILVELNETAVANEAGLAYIGEQLAAHVILTTGHEGGEATCTELAVCVHCGAEYGELAEHDYRALGQNSEMHWIACVNCYGVKEGTEGYHYGGTATCCTQAVCEFCESVIPGLIFNYYGELDPDNHESDEYNYLDNKDGATHTKKHACCDVTADASEAHSYTGNTCDHCGYTKSTTPYNPPYNPPADGHCPGCGEDVCHSEAFSDLNLNAWYHEYTDYVLCKGLMIGMGGDMFAPEFTTNRAMLVTTLYRFAGSPAVDGEMPYEDVLEGQWYSDAVIWATENNIVEGYGNGCFGPFDTLTREQSATIFYRYAKLLGLDVSGSDDVLAGYQDADQVSDWAVDGIKWAVTSGMMNGRSTTVQILCPKDSIKRDEIAALLYRWCEEINN